MTDIVERLHGHPGDGQTVTEQFRNMVEQRHEAAEEIVRLRAALQLILDECEGDDILTAWGIGDVAHRALEHKP